MNNRRNFLKKSTTLAASSLLPTNFLPAITDSPIPNFNGFLDGANIFYGNFHFVELDGFLDIFKNNRGIFKFTDLPKKTKKCFVMSPFHYLLEQNCPERFKATPTFRLEDAQLKTLGINPEDFNKVISYWYNNSKILDNDWRFLPSEKWKEFQNLPEYKNCCVEIPFEKMARILGKDDISCPLQFFAFNASPEWYDYFDVFLESKGIQNFRNQTCKFLENIRFNFCIPEENIKFLEKVKARLESNKKVVTHCSEVITQFNQLIKVIHIHVEDHKIYLQEKHYNQSNQDPDWYHDNTDIFATTKERFHE